MDTFAYTLHPNAGAFEWEGEGIILTLKTVCAEGPGKLLCQPGGLDDFYPIAILNEQSPNVSLDLPFCEKVAFKAMGDTVHIAGIVERADDMESDDDESETSDDDDMEDAPGLILDSEDEMSDSNVSEVSGGSEQRVTVEEVPMSDNESNKESAPAAPSSPQKSITGISKAKQQLQEKAQVGGEVSTADVSSTGESDDEEQRVVEVSGGKSSEETQADKLTKSKGTIKGDSTAVPLKEKISGKQAAKDKSVTKTGKKKEKATEVKKQQPKVEVKAKMEQKKADKSVKSEAKQEGAKQQATSEPAQGGESVKPGLRKVLPGGTSYEILSVGKSKLMAKRGKKVTVAYRGTLKNGKEFDKGSLSFVLGAGEVVPGFDKGVDGMMVGEKRRLYIPAKEGYGSSKTGPIPPNSDLLFEVTLRNIN